MRVFVAGGNGALGKPLLPLLVAAGHTVVAATRKADAAAGWARLRSGAPQRS